MQYIFGLIEKIGETYTGRTLCLPGVLITASSYLEAADGIINATESRLNELYEMHPERPVVISRRPLEESIPCVYEYGKGERCGATSQKDALCRIHWKKLYSHAFGTTIHLKACPLCGEADRKVLKQWDSVCPVKKENPNWEQLLEDTKAKMHFKWAKEKKEVRLESLKGHLRCTATLKNGSQCLVSAALSKNLCARHLFKKRS